MSKSPQLLDEQYQRENWNRFWELVGIPNKMCQNNVVNELNDEEFDELIHCISEMNKYWYTKSYKQMVPINDMFIFGNTYPSPFSYINIIKRDCNSNQIERIDDITKDKDIGLCTPFCYKKN